jgi:hypothetical protein
MISCCHPNRLPLLRPYSLRKFAANTLLTSRLPAAGLRSFFPYVRTGRGVTAGPGRAPASAGLGGDTGTAATGLGGQGRRPPAASRRVPAGAGPTSTTRRPAGARPGSTTTVPGPVELTVARRPRSLRGSRDRPAAEPAATRWAVTAPCCWPKSTRTSSPRSPRSARPSGGQAARRGGGSADSGGGHAAGSAPWRPAGSIVHWIRHVARIHHNLFPRRRTTGPAGAFTSQGGRGSRRRWPGGGATVALALVIPAPAVSGPPSRKGSFCPSQPHPWTIVHKVLLQA